MLSCYDAHLRYDRRTDTFTARYVTNLIKVIMLLLTHCHELTIALTSITKS